MPIRARVLSLGSRVPWFRIDPIDESQEALTPEYAKDPVTGNWRPLLVMFLCSHSPYVQHIQHHLSGMIRQYQAQGLAAIAISPNDPLSYPSDDLGNLRAQLEGCDFSFPYALDANQSVARAFEASCTPEFFLYQDMDRGGRLAYHGEYDSSRPGGEPSGDPLRRAIEAVLGQKAFGENQDPSFGCSVKWKSGLDASVAYVMS